MGKKIDIQTTRVYTEIDKAVKGGKRVISLQGSSRASKTYNTLIYLIAYLLSNRNTRLSIVRGTIPALKKSVFVDLKEILVKFGVFDARALNKSELIYHLPNGSWIEMFSTDDEQKIRGSKRDVLFINEANEIDYTAYTQLMMRTTRFAILDYNPSYSDEHWLCGVNRDEKTYHFISTYLDNPFLEQTVIDEIESLRGKNKALWEIYGLGQQSLVEGLVFPSITLIDEFPENAKHQALAIDYGFSNDPTAIVKCGIIDDNLYIDEICYRTQMRTQDIIDELRPYKEMKIISESADPRLVHEISLAGFWIIPVKKGAGSVEAGIMFMQGLNIHVTKNSLNAIKEFRNYIYAKTKEGKQLGVPIDAFNHCFTGDTLITTDKGQVPIKDISIGDMVLTSKGYRKVNKVFDNGRKEIHHVKLIFPTFVTEVKCTSNHKFKTTKGWKELREIESGNVLYLCKNLTEKYTDYTKESGITQKETRECTWLYGSTIMARFLKGIMYTTKMRIRLTTQLITSGLLMVENTLASIVGRGLRKSESKQQEKQWTMRGSLQVYGTEAKRAESGTESTGKRSWIISNIRSILVRFAGKSINRKATVLTGFAQTIASQHIGEAAEQTTKRGFVNNVGKSSQQIDIARRRIAERNVLQDICQLSKQEQNVYDIEVDGTHEYFANGVLVHNCMDASRYFLLSELVGKNRDPKPFNKSKYGFY